MDLADLHRSAAHNRRAFDQTLSSYVQLKLAQLDRHLSRQASDAWFDASGCVWCLFDDPAFERVGEEARSWQDTHDQPLDLQRYWSMGDVVMPEPCSPDWVASKIAAEAERQLSLEGYRTTQELRTVEGEQHLGVALHRRHWWQRR